MVRKVGGSLMVTVPKEVVNALGVKSNQKLRVDFKKSKISGFGIYKGAKYTAFKREDRADWPNRID